jgi:hypothetical protein
LTVTECSQLGASVADHEITLFPNPASTTITLHGLPTGTKRLRVHRTTGRVVLTASAGVPQLPIEGLSPGTYVIHPLDALGMPMGQARFVKY